MSTGRIRLGIILTVLVSGCVAEGNSNRAHYFSMSNDLSCTVKKATDKKNVGRTLSLLELGSDNPRLLVNKTGGTYPLAKLHEDENSLTVGQIGGGSGSTDIFFLNKETGEFARTESGDVSGIYASASQGTCK